MNHSRQFLTVLLGLSLAGVPAYAAAAEDIPAGPGPERLEQIAKRLDLTDAQRANLREVGGKQLRRGIQERADIQIAALDLHKLVRADQPDQKAIDAQVDKLAGMRAQLQKERIATLLEMRSVLTAEQRAKAEKMREDMPGSMRMRGIRKIEGRPGLHIKHGAAGTTTPMPDGGGPPVN